MKKLISLFVLCCFLIIIVFLLFGNVENWVTVNLSSNKSLLTYTLLSSAALISDIILPIPSSLVMVLNGKILGVFAGTVVSLISGVISSLTGFYFGRKANPFLNNLFSRKDKEVSNKLFEKFGNIAIIISKALPIISEAISFVSGTTSVTIKTFFLYSIIGHFIVAFIYACVGSFTTSVNSNIVAAVIITAALLIGWISQIILRRKAVHKSIAENRMNTAQ